MSSSGKWFIAGFMFLNVTLMAAQSNSGCFTCALEKEKKAAAAARASGKAAAKPSARAPVVVPVKVLPETSSQAQAAQAASTASAPGKTESAETREAKSTASTRALATGEVKLLRDLVTAQQAQIEEQRQQLSQLKAQVQELIEASRAASAEARQLQAKATDAQKTAAAANDKVEALTGALSGLKADTDQATKASQDATKTVGELAHPTTIRYKGITLAPGGFVTADSIVRTRNENADVTSNFGAVPFDGVANAHLSEFRFTARASRLTLLAEGTAGNAKLSGYYEVDFLGQPPTANQVQTNSFSPRQRQLWAQAAFTNGLTVSAGQYWSLITTDRKGIAIRAEFIPNTIEGAYVVGYNYVRQTAFRLTRNLNDRLWMAFEVANPETNQPNASFVPANLFGFNNSTNAASPNGSTLNFLTGSTNGFSTNLAPDLLGKITWEPGWGHYEFKVLGRFFRDRIGGNTNIAYGGGLGAAAILPLVAKKADFIIEGLAGNGIGRYGAANGSDITLRPDGWIIPLHAVHFMSGLELHPYPRLDVYLYGGDEYYRRAAYVDPTNPAKPAGYGSVLVVNTNCQVEVIPSGGAACGAQNKNAWDITGGLWYRAYKGPFGTLQYGLQYEALHRSTWSGVGGTPLGSDSVVLSSFRFLLP